MTLDLEAFSETVERSMSSMAVRRLAGLCGRWALFAVLPGLRWSLARSARAGKHLIESRVCF